MRKALVLLAVAGLAGAANAAVTYNDSTGDLFDNGFTHLDIVSVDVNHDASDIFININVLGDIDATTWGKYTVGISTSAGFNDTTNGWGRNISWGGQVIDYWIGTWADDGGSGFGAELRQMSGANDTSNVLVGATWSANFPGSGSAAGFTQTITVSRASLGLIGDQTFFFDVMTTGGGGGDPGVDHLSRADMATTDWSVQSVSGNFLAYTIPTPGAAALLGLGGLAMLRRRRA